MALIRYPGSKSKLLNKLIPMFPHEITQELWSHARPWEYREPFFGSGECGFDVLQVLNPDCVIWLNDIDADLVCLWQSVKEQPGELRDMVHSFTPSVDAFFEFKARDGKNDGTRLERGFRKLALHRMSVSGFGYMSGGPIGGKGQDKSEYTVGCRWQSSRIRLTIDKLSRRMNDFKSLRITCMDFAEVIADAPEESFIYLDPPYYEKGNQLYRHGMTHADHERLADTLRSVRCKWVLSYDDHQEIRRLYEWCDFTELEITYSNATHAKARRPKNSEVAITRKVA